MGDNLSYNDLFSDIENDRIKGIYLFYGCENFLISEAINKLQKKLVSENLRNINFIKLDGTALNQDDMINACETLPFMDRWKVVLVSDCSFFKSRKADKGNDGDENNTEELALYLERLPESTVLVLTAGEQADKRRKIYNVIKKYGEIIEFKNLKGQELLKWVTEEFKRSGKIIHTGDAQYLVSRINGNLGDILNEINKLVYYTGKGQNVTVRDIDAVVPKSLENNIFQLVDNISNKNPGAALAVLNELLLESEPVAMILFMIARQYRLLLNTKLLSEKGYSNQEISSKLGVQYFVMSKLIVLSKLYSERQLTDKLSYCLETDNAIKRGMMDPRIAVESLIVEFAK